MAIQDKLDTAWETNLSMDSLFEFRALVGQGGGFYGFIQQVLTQIDAIAARDEFADVDAELKTEGVAIRAIIQTCKTALDAHSVFLNWTQP